jgi:hypothetical protein
MVNQGEVHFDALLDSKICKALGHPLAICFIGDLLAELG